MALLFGECEDAIGGCFRYFSTISDSISSFFYVSSSCYLLPTPATKHIVYKKK